MSETGAAAEPEARGYRKVREGLVVSDKMDKTVVVEVRTGSSTPSTARSSAALRGTRRTMARTPAASATGCC